MRWGTTLPVKKRLCFVQPPFAFFLILSIQETFLRNLGIVHVRFDLNDPSNLTNRNLLYRRSTDPYLFIVDRMLRWQIRFLRRYAHSGDTTTLVSSVEKENLEWQRRFDTGMPYIRPVDAFITCATTSLAIQLSSHSFYFLFFIILLVWHHLLSWESLIQQSQSPCALVLFPFGKPRTGLYSIKNLLGFFYLIMVHRSSGETTSSFSLLLVCLTHSLCPKPCQNETL